MSKRLVRAVHIVGCIAECELCGRKEELRPYGPNGENICFDCGMKNEATTTRKFFELIDEADIVVIE